jgi:hypothetical protein
MKIRHPAVRELDPEIRRMTDEMMARLNQRLHLLEAGPSDPDAFVREATHEIMDTLDRRLTLLDAENGADGHELAHPASPRGVEPSGNRAAFASTD